MVDHDISQGKPNTVEIPDTMSVLVYLAMV